MFLTIEEAMLKRLEQMANVYETEGMPRQVTITRPEGIERNKQQEDGLWLQVALATSERYFELICPRTSGMGDLAVKHYFETRSKFMLELDYIFTEGEGFADGTWPIIELFNFEVSINTKDVRHFHFKAEVDLTTFGKKGGVNRG